MVGLGFGLAVAARLPALVALLLVSVALLMVSVVLLMVLAVPQLVVVGLELVWAVGPGLSQSVLARVTPVPVEMRIAQGQERR